MALQKQYFISGTVKELQVKREDHRLPLPPLPDGVVTEFGGYVVKITTDIAGCPLHDFHNILPPTHTH